MSNNNPHNRTPGYTFQSNSPAQEYLDVARIHHREAKQLFDSAQAALAEDRQEEARLLTDLAIARRERAEAFERAARGEGGDPIVAEILAGQQNTYQPYSPTYVAPDEALPEGWLSEMKPRPLGRIARAVAWIGSWIS